MRRVLINTQNYLFGDAIAEALKHTNSDFEVNKADNPEEIIETNKWFVPYALLMEVSGYSPWLLEERLKTSAEVRHENPHCKIVLIVDENAEKATAEKVKQTKKDGLIDQFIYGSISSTYLTALIDTL